MSRRVAEIIRREYMERIKKKSFWISTFILPILMIGSMLLPAFFATVSLKERVKIGVIDLNGSVFEEFKNNFIKIERGGSSQKLLLKTGKKKQVYVEKLKIIGSVETTLERAKSLVASKKYDGCLFVGKELDKPGNFSFYSRNVGDVSLLSTVKSALNPIVIRYRLLKNNISAKPEEVKKWTKSVAIVTYKVEESGKVKKRGSSSAIFTTFAFVLILYIALIFYGVANLRGVLEEKTSRIMEVLLANFSPMQIMTGKLLGIGLVGLTQMGVYAICGAFLFIYGAYSATSIESGFLSELSSLNPVIIVYFIIFFILGYFIFSALFLAVGSLCSTEEDAQNMQGPVVMLLVLPMISTMFFITNPDSVIAVVVSMIPVFTPMVMLMRIIVMTPPFWQIVMSIVLCIIFIVMLMWAVAKIFRIGILMYGKRPSLKQIYTWLKTD